MAIQKYRHINERLELFAIVLGISEGKRWSRATGDLFSLIARRSFPDLARIKERLDDGFGVSSSSEPCGAG